MNMATPLVVYSRRDDLAFNDETRWPSANAALSDLVNYKIIAGGQYHGETGIRDGRMEACLTA